MPAHGNSGLSKCTEEWNGVVSVSFTLLLLVILLSTVASVSMWRPSTSFLLRPAPICSTSVIFLLGRCFLLGAFSCSSLGQSPVPSWFSRYFGLLVTTAGSGIVISHSSVPFLLCLVTVPTIAGWMVIAVAARETGIWHGASVVLLGLTLPDVQLLLSWGSDDSPSGEATGVHLSAGFVSNAGPPLPWLVPIRTFPLGTRIWNLTIPRCRGWRVFQWWGDYRFGVCYSIAPRKEAALHKVEQVQEHPTDSAPKPILWSVSFGSSVFFPCR